MDQITNLWKLQLIEAGLDLILASIILLPIIIYLIIKRR